MKYLIDTHTHTLASGHAYNTIDEMTRSASEKGLANIAFTEHAPKMPGSCGILYFSNLRVLSREKFGVNRLFGCEANIIKLDGTVDMPEYMLEKMDIVIASFHTPCIKAGDVRQNTECLIKIMENPYINIIGHPDDSRYPIEMEAVVKVARDKHKLLELNNTSLKPAGPRQGTRENDIAMLNFCKKYDVCISLGSDAHVEENICNFELAEQLLEEVDFPERLVANTDMDLMNSYLHNS